MRSPREFSCGFPGCNKSYQRKEHLNRHKAQHVPQQSFQCPICGRIFGRNDTLRRHVRQSHQGHEPTPSTRQACVNCRALKSRCKGGPPCTGCLRRQIHCSFYDQPRISGKDHRPHQVVKPSCPEKIQHFLKLYFKLFHPYWPFIHQGSFNQSNETPLLVQSMVVIGMWATDVRSTRSAATDLHKTLNSAIYQQREKWDASVAENASSICSWPVPMYQAILIHIIFSLIRKGSISLGLDLKPSLPAIDTGLLASLVLSCRRLGMFHYPNMIARYQPHDLASYVWVGVEEVKRFDLALYRVCKALISGKQNTNMEECGTPGVTSWQLTASELQFPMPKNDLLWNAVSKEEWNSAVTEDVDSISLGDVGESEWISKSAELLQLT